MQGILIVSDNLGTGEWAVGALTTSGHRVALHHKASAIAIAVAEYRADLVVLDAAMLDLKLALTCLVLKKWRPRLSLVILGGARAVPTDSETGAPLADAWIDRAASAEAFAQTIQQHLPAPIWVSALQGTSDTRSLA